MTWAWARNLINLIYPLSCLICHIRLDPLNEEPLCAACWDKIEYNLPPFCRRCGKHLPAASQGQALFCRDCQISSYFFKQAHYVCVYDGIIKECIHLLKYNRKLSLVKPLAKLMINFADKFINLEGIDYLVPVPVHSVKARQREFNQAQLLAKLLSAAFKKELKDGWLVKTKVRPAQVSLSRAERALNVRGSFMVKPSVALKGANVLLIDDVLTTASTVNECAKVLLQAGAKRVEAFALARGN